MSVIRDKRLLLRLLKDINDVRTALRRVTVNLPLYDINNENTPDQITVNQNNYVVGNYDVLRMSSDGNKIITGMKGGVKGRKLQVFNVGSSTLMFSHQNTDSDAENRFKFRGNAPAFVEAGDTVVFYYDETQSRWIEATNVFDFDLGNAWTNYTNAASPFLSIAWSSSLNLFVAPMGTTGLKTSPDGITWTSRVVPATISWIGSTWAEELGLFVVVGGAFGAATVGQRVITSPDGITWTTRVSTEDAAGDYWNDVVWSPDLSLLVAVGEDTGGTDSAMTSPDGITWTARTIAADQNYQRVVWGSDAGMFIALGGVNLVSSPDGITWTLRQSTDTKEGLAWSEELSLFVALRDVIYTSPDGITWTERTAPSALVKTCVAWSKELNIFLAVGGSTADTIWSSDGINWNSGDPPTGDMKDVAWSSELGVFVAVGLNASAITP